MQVEGWDPVQEQAVGPSDSRFVLVTDLGVLAKKNADGTREIYVEQLSKGLPAVGARVQVLGRNGLPVVESATDSEGHAHLGDLGKLSREKEPVVYLVELGGDLSFLPVERADRTLDFSRFDTGGLHDDQRVGALHAYVFSDRGLYRPGDEIHVGAAVKQPIWDRSVAGVTLVWSVTDPRSAVLLEKRVKLSPAGFEELAFTTRETSATGTYTLSLYTVRDDHPADLVGSVSVRVEEFLPDRLRIASHFSEERLDGWVKPEGLAAEVSLRNLFGTPAENRRVTAHVTLSPMSPVFRRYPEFTFHDPVEGKHSYGEDLSPAQTDATGQARFPLDLARYEKATYRVAFSADGFEAEGGRAVSTESSVLVTPFDFLVGVKPDGDLAYVARDSKRAIQILAVDSRLEPKAVAGLNVRRLEERYVSVLTEQQNGTYHYVSTRKEITLEEKPLPASARAQDWPLDTRTPGNYLLQILGPDGVEMSRVRYAVAGRANLSRALDKNAELEVKLDRKDYAGGEEIQVAITAPYTGAGLITIERDRVYAQRWFRATTTSSVQSITVPKELEGNGYVTVTFLRALDSPEVFMSPLSTGVVPFSVSRAARSTEVSLEVPQLVKPGQELEIGYRVDKPTRLVVFGADEGILQVARYKTPDPLAYFFRKRALQVSTSQILDLLLPEFSVLARASAAGGDEGAGALGKNLNPFKRKRDKPAVFWSGLLEAKPGPGVFRYRVPDSFNGELRVMAVAVSQESVGARAATVTVRGPFVLSPNAPTFLAPGDESQVSVGVANGVAGSGPKAQVEVTLETSAGLEVLEAASRTLAIGEGREGSATFRVRATAKLGSATLTFAAASGTTRSRVATDLSVRPATPYLVTVAGGGLKNAKADLPHARHMFPEERKLTARVSHLPLGLAGGLADYLQAYPYGCTEQVVSQAFPALVLQDRPELGYSAARVQSNLERAYRVLAERQNGDGAFGMWAANSFVSDLQTAYAAHFLTEARELEQGAPREVLKRALDYLSGLSEAEVQNLSEARAHAYALYVLARNGRAVGGAAAALQKRLEVLDTSKSGDWRRDLCGLQLAATFKLLKQDSLAEAIVTKTRLGQPVAADYNAYYDGLVRDGQYLFLMARHFPERLKALAPGELEALSGSLAHGYNSFSGANALLGFDALARALVGDVGANAPPPVVSELQASGPPRPLALPKGLFASVTFADDATAVRFADASGLPLFYGLTEGGFDLDPPQQTTVAGLEIERELRQSGKTVAKAALGEIVEVHLKARSLGGTIGNVALVDLLPAGFEVVIEHPAPPAAQDRPDAEAPPDGDEGSDEGEPGNGGGVPSGMATYIAKGGDLPVDAADVREDRVLLFATVDAKAREFVYDIRATNAGKVKVPPLFGESMYDRSVQARSLGSTFEVVAP